PRESPRGVAAARRAVPPEIRLTVSHGGRLYRSRRAGTGDRLAGASLRRAIGPRVQREGLVSVHAAARAPEIRRPPQEDEPGVRVTWGVPQADPRLSPVHPMRHPRHTHDPW